MDPEVAGHAIIPAHYIIMSIVSLVGAIAFLWNGQREIHKEKSEELKEVRELREKDTDEIKELHSKVGELAGLQKGIEIGVEQVSSKVIQEIRSLREETKRHDTE
jgi:hypothetical protein